MWTVVSWITWRRQAARSLVPDLPVVRQPPTPERAPRALLAAARSALSQLRVHGAGLEAGRGRRTPNAIDRIARSPAAWRPATSSSRPRVFASSSPASSNAPDPDRVAIVPSVSYAMATVARNTPLAAGRTVVVVEEQFPSAVYTWRRACRASRSRAAHGRGPGHGGFARRGLERRPARRHRRPDGGGGAAAAALDRRPAVRSGRHRRAGARRRGPARRRRDAVGGRSSRSTSRAPAPTR